MPPVDIERAWELVDRPLPRDNTGFLAEPTWPKSPFPTLTSLRGIRALALLGDPGMGKSTDLARAYPGASDSPYCAVDLATCGDARDLRELVFGDRRVKTAIERKAEVEIVLDSLDEALLTVPNAPAILAAELRRVPARLLRLRIACRAAEWPRVLHNGLTEHFGGEYEVRRLAPLRRSDVRRFFADGARASAFLTAVFERDVTALATTPMMVEMLVAEYNANSALPNSRAELYRRACLRLLSETSLYRQDRAGPEELGAATRRLAVARRLAAVTNLARRPVIRLDGLEIDSAEAPLSLIVGGVEESAAVQVAVDHAAVIDTVRTALFRTVGERVTWSHWTFAEYLTSEYLRARAVTPAAIGALVLRPDGAGGRRVAPALGELAAWCSREPEVFDLLLDADPEALLVSAATDLSALSRARLTHRVLDMSRSDELDTRAFYERGVNFSLFQHDDLDAALEKPITDRDTPAHVRRVALLIAGECRREGLRDAIRVVVLDATEHHHLRAAAGRALRKMGARTEVTVFRSLLAPAADDPDDELRGVALSALWPDSIGVDELWTHLSPPKRLSFLGAYASFLLFAVADRLIDSQLPSALAWSKGHLPTDGVDRLGRLAQDIVERAWTSSFGAEIVAGLGALLVVGWQRFESYVSSAAPPGRRYEVARAALRVSASEEQLTPRYLTQCRPPVFTRADVPWLADRLRAEPDPEDRARLSGLLASVYEGGDVELFELMFEARASIPELHAATTALYEPVRLDSPAAANARRYHHEDEARRRRDRERERERDDSRAAAVEEVGKLADRFDEGDVDAWWKLHLQLTEDHWNAELQPDIRRLSCWEALDARLRDRIIGQSKRYLEMQDPATVSWLGTSTFHRPAAAGYRALWLLLDVALSDLDGLGGVTWAKWAAMTLAFPNSIDTGDAGPRDELARRAYVAAAPAFVAALQRLVVHESSERDGHVFVAQRLAKAWDPALVRVVAVLAQNRLARPHTVRTLLEEMLDHGGASATAEIQQLLTQHPGDVTLAVCALTHRPAETWAQLSPLLLTRGQFARDVWLAFGQHGRRLDKAFVTAVGAAVTADVYVHLARAFPRAEDPEFDDVHLVGDRESLGRFRNGLLSELEELGTADGVAALERVHEAFPEVTWLATVCARARRRCAEAAVSTLSVPDVLRLGRRARPILTRVRVFIASANDLDAECQAARALVAMLDTEYRSRNLVVESIRWEWDAVGVHPAGPQGPIDAKLDEADIVVVLVGDRVGAGTRGEAHRTLKLGRPMVILHRGRAEGDVLAFLEEIQGAHPPFADVDDLKSKLASYLRQQLDRIADG